MLPPYFFLEPACSKRIPDNSLFPQPCGRLTRDPTHAQVESLFARSRFSLFCLCAAAEVQRPVNNRSEVSHQARADK